MFANDPHALWESIRQSLAGRLPERTFQDWIEPCEPTTFDGATLRIQTPSSSAKVWIEQQLAEEFHDALHHCGLPHLRLSFSVAGETPAAPAKAATSKKKSVTVASEPHGMESPFPQGFDRYTLDRFVVGPGSQLAFAAANAVVQNHDKSSAHLNMNPLFIYGGSGLGKTHLMIGIGKGLLAHHPNLRMAYLKVDNFFNEFTMAINSKNTDALRKKYQANDVLLLDDIQTLGRMERTQEEIFYIFEYLLQHGKTIVITSDKPPERLDGLHDRLRTRCKWGLTADIQPPDFETRVAILRKKLEDDAFKDLPSVSEEVLNFIAHKAKGSVRDMEGLLTRVVFQSSFLGVVPNLEVAYEAFRGQTGEEATAGVSMERICRMTAETYNVPYLDLIKKKSRQQSILLPRQVAMYLARELTNSSFGEIGRVFNNMHHSTVMNAIDSVKSRMQKDQDFHRQVHSLLNSIS
ncbi:MAG: chromosomal replication initiator protein DnaA [Firmicutes bacterium]|nr:chromosomal replication initiator protein DnaA [Bacillota bacterium]